MSTSTLEGKDSSKVVIFSPQHHSSQHLLYEDNDLEVFLSKHPKGAYDPKAMVLFKREINQSSSLRQTPQQEIRNVCSETTEICYDIQHGLGRDVAELRSDLE